MLASQVGRRYGRVGYLVPTYVQACFGNLARTYCTYSYDMVIWRFTHTYYCSTRRYRTRLAVFLAVINLSPYMVIIRGQLVVGRYSARLRMVRWYVHIAYYTRTDPTAFLPRTTRCPPTCGTGFRLLSFSLSEYEYRGIRVFYVTYCFCATEINWYSYCRSVFVATTCHTSVVRSPKAPLRNAVPGMIGRHVGNTVPSDGSYFLRLLPTALS